jgi:hypothetical protein
MLNEDTGYLGRGILELLFYSDRWDACRLSGITYLSHLVSYNQMSFWGPSWVEPPTQTRRSFQTPSSQYLQTLQLWSALAGGG